MPRAWQIVSVHAYFSKSVYQKDLVYELSAPEVIDEHLVLSPELSQPVFALDIWPDCEVVAFTSINEAIKQLKARSLRWYYYGSRYFRRGALIAAGLKQIENKPVDFHLEHDRHLSEKAFACFTLLSENQLLVCRHSWKKWPLGQIEFIENKTIPPNRAYLKLWEVFTLLGQYPKAGELAVDLGAAPGGWSWVLADCGAKVIAIDKAPLDPRIQALSNIHFQTGSAFAVNPNDFQQIDWLCSDIICYPDRLYGLIQKFMDSGKVKNMICTIKLQGELDWQIIKRLQAIAGARVIHLFHNKHELTFYKLKA